MHIKPRFLPMASSLALAVTLALSGCGKAPQGGMPQSGPAEVGVVTIKSQSVTLSKELPARTSSFTVADIRPQVGGIVTKRLFTEGGEVKAGQVLYEINPETYQASYLSAQAELAKAQATLESAELKAKRYAELVQIKAVSTQDNDDAQSTLAQDKASVASAKASLETARINLAYTKVTSPITGRIGKSSVTQGALVSAAQTTALATVQQLDPIYVDMTQSSTELLQLKRDFANGALKAKSAKAQVELTLEDGSKYKTAGTLEFSDVTVDSGTGMVTLRAIFPNPNKDLLPGMFVRARLTQGVRDNGILVPVRAVMRNQKGESYVYVVDKDSKVVTQSVKVNQIIGSDWLVDAGLQVGQSIIVDGLQKVRDGVAVKATAVEDKPAASAAK